MAIKSVVQSVESFVQKALSLKGEYEGQYQIGRLTTVDDDGIPSFDLTDDDALDALRKRCEGEYYLVKTEDISQIVSKCRISAQGMRTPHWRQPNVDSERAAGKAVSSVSESWERLYLSMLSKVESYDKKIDALEAKNDALREENWTLTTKLREALDASGEDVWSTVLERVMVGWQTKNVNEAISNKLGRVLSRLNEKEQQVLRKAYAIAEQLPEEEDDDEEAAQAVQ